MHAKVIGVWAFSRCICAKMRSTPSVFPSLEVAQMAYEKLHEAKRRDRISAAAGRGAPACSPVHAGCDLHVLHLLKEFAHPAILLRVKVRAHRRAESERIRFDLVRHEMLQNLV